VKIRLENVSKSLSFKEHFNARAEVLHLLEGINYELDDGENLAILGQSGSGKSTLAKLISFSEPKSGGKIYINNEEITDKNELKKDGILIDFVLLEGGNATGLDSLNEYPNLREKNAENISVIIGQDAYIAGLETENARHGAIGSALGMLCVRQVSENIGSTDILNKPDDKKGRSFYSLTESGLKRFVTASLSTGQKISELTNEQIKSLVAKGYIFVGPYIGASGMYFSGSATCCTKTSDYAYIENNRVWNKAARLIREALAPFLKGKVKKDPSTGYIKATTIAHWERVCAKASIERMEAENDISGGEIYISEKQSPTEDVPLKISVKIVVDDIVHSFNVDLSLTNKL